MQGITGSAEQRREAKRAALGERAAAAMQALSQHESERRQLAAVRSHMEDARMLLERVKRRERLKKEGAADSINQLDSICTSVSKLGQ